MRAPVAILAAMRPQWDRPLLVLQLEDLRVHGAVMLPAAQYWLECVVRQELVRDLAVVFDCRFFLVVALVFVLEGRVYLVHDVLQAGRVVGGMVAV